MAFPLLTKHLCIKCSRRKRKPAWVLMIYFHNSTMFLPEESRKVVTQKGRFLLFFGQHLASRHREGGKILSHPMQAQGTSGLSPSHSKEGTPLPEERLLTFSAALLTCSVFVVQGLGESGPQDPSKCHILSSLSPGQRKLLLFWMGAVLSASMKPWKEPVS